MEVGAFVRQRIIWKSHTQVQIQWNLQVFIRNVDGCQHVMTNLNILRFIPGAWNNPRMSLNLEFKLSQQYL